MTIVLIIGMVVLLVAVTAVVLVNAQNLTAQAGRGRARQEAEVIQSRFKESRQDVLATAEFLLSRVALEKALAQGQTPADIRSMMVVGVLAIDLDNVAIVDPNGVYVTGIQRVEGDIITSPQRDALLALALSGTGTKATGVILETDGSALWLAAVVPLRGTTREITGALLAARQVDDELLQELNFSREDVHLALVANGQILAQDFPSPELLSEFSTALTEEPYAGPSLSEETIVADDLLRSAEGVPYALAHFPLTEANASTAILVDMGELYNFQRQLMVTTAIVLSSLALAAVLGVALFTRTSIAVPLGRLRSVAERMASGDYQQLAEVKTADEVGQLASTFNDMATQLRQTLESLEQRTVDLQHRSVQLQASAEVARGAVSILEVDQLIRQVVDLIRERFDLYYVGLFLLDEERQFAVLHAGTGEAGQEMLVQGHRLEVGGGSMIGQCTAKAEAAIALDVGEEAVHFDNPLLPETRSEMALPLRSRGRIIGAMSVQSAEAAAFDEEDVSVMQTMADQVAVAIDNARLLAESQAALEAERRAYGEFSGQAWRELLRIRTDWGYHYTRQAITPVEGDWRPEMRQAERIGQSVQGNPERAEGGDGTNGTALAMPIQVRGETVGVIGFRKGEGSKTWTAEEVILLETLVTQLGLALESAWLYQDTQQRAIREQLTAEITGRIRETLDMDTVLKTAAQEIREVLGLHDVKIQMQVLGQDS
ncbi:MAG: GAF domain-containing protein [Anaerolineae bacterium]|nr:GAF domain-containing protein [Anaerolineae bacterium]